MSGKDAFHENLIKKTIIKPAHLKWFRNFLE